VSDKRVRATDGSARFLRRPVSAVRIHGSIGYFWNESYGRIYPNLKKLAAGICEEVAFRGYLLRQMHALTGSIVAAVLFQGLIFGLFHAYQGFKNAIAICILGLLYGALAAGRKNLRAHTIAHSWSDVWEGWLKFHVWPQGHGLRLTPTAAGYIRKAVEFLWSKDRLEREIEPSRFAT